MGNKKEYKVGDKVLIRTWKDMENEFGLADNGLNIAYPSTFLKGMKTWCGKTLTIAEIRKSSGFHKEDFKMKECDELFWESDFEQDELALLIKEKIEKKSGKK
jgi:hypothetical protein